VLALMIGHTGNPSAAAHCLAHLRLALANLKTHRDLGPANPLVVELARLEEVCHDLDPAKILAAAAGDSLVDLRRQVEALHQGMEDAYFSHQHAFAVAEQRTIEFH